MNADRYVMHVTLTTGHQRRSGRSEVADDVIARLVPLIRPALQGERVPIPGMVGYSMSGGRHGRCMIMTVWIQSPLADRPQPIPILTTGVAPHSRCGAYLWRFMHESAVATPTKTDPSVVPPEPWVADRIEIGAAFALDAMQWTGDFSRCLGWAWLEFLESERNDGNDNG